MSNLKRAFSRHGLKRGSLPAGEFVVRESAGVRSPYGLVIAIAACVFLAETSVMIAISLLPGFSALGKAFFDAALLILILSPVLYILVYRPYSQRIDEIKRAEHLVEETNEKLENEVQARTAELQKKAYELNERVKELNCLYSISHLIEQHGNSLEKIFQGTIDLISPSWQYPDITCARICIDGQELKTGNFKETNWKQTSNIIVRGEPVGTIEIFYLEKRPKIDEGPFLKEERKLINAIALVLGRLIERSQNEEKLNRESKLNAALSELYEPLISPEATIEDIAYTVLEKAKSLTKSVHGFVATIDPSTGDMVSHTLTEMLRNECTVISDEGIKFPISSDGRYPSLWGYALNTGRPFFTNAAPNHQSATGIPDGHIPIQRFLSVPVMLGNELAGQIALANNAEDYTEMDLEAITRVAEFYALAVQRSRVKEELQRAYDELEHRVEARTTEIKQAYENLIKETNERKIAQEQLSRSKSMLQLVFDGISEPLILVDRDMKIKMINQPGAEYYGLADYREAINKICYQATQKSEMCNGCEIAQAVSNGKNITFERKGYMDSERLERIVVYPLKGNRGEAGDAIVRISDITEAKLLERQLIQSEKMASLGILVSSIAHEVNNPNSFVSFNIPILKDYLKELMPIVDEYAEKRPDFTLFNMAYDDFKVDIFKLLKNIEHGSKRISSFVSNLREYSLGKDNNPIKEVDLIDIIEHAFSMCQSKISKSVNSFFKNFPEKSPIIFSDPYALEQILINLLLNAAQAADKKGSWIRLDVKNNDSSQEHIVIEISDNGCGIDEKTQLRIFDPFYTTKTSAEGTGLGLFVCHNLARDLGGRIEVQSHSGQGSTFRVVLPISRARRDRVRQDNPIREG